MKYPYQNNRSRRHSHYFCHHLHSCNT